MTPHPGTIVFVEEGSATEKVVAAADVPEAVAFVRQGDKRIPVVRVEAKMLGDQRVITSYGADGARLTATYQRKT